MGSVQLSIEKNAKNGNQITWRHKVGLKHRAYVQTGLNRPFNKFKVW